MICSHCQVEISTSSQDGCCWNCGYPLSQEISTLSTENKLELIDKNTYILIHIREGIQFTIGNNEVIPIKISNLSEINFSLIVIEAICWNYAMPVQREVWQNLSSNGELTVGLPIVPEAAGQLLITSLMVTLHADCGTVLKYRATEEIIIPVSKDTNTASKINQITLNGYAQLVGHVIMDYNKSGWYPIPAICTAIYSHHIKLPPLPSHPAPNDYCYLQIQSSGQCIYLCSRPEIWLGRSSYSEFQTLPIDHKQQQIQKISAKQAKISYQGDRWLLLDPASANGTWINNQRLPLNTNQILKDRDIIDIANIIKLTVHFYHNKRFSPTTVTPQELYNSPQDLWKQFGGIGTPGPYNALKLSYDDQRQDNYIIIIKSIIIGSDPNHAIYLPELPADILGEIIYAGGYFWYNYCDGCVRYNHRFLNDCEVVPICIGDRFQLANTEIIVGID